MANERRIIPPVKYDPERGYLLWQETKDFNPLDIPLNGINDRAHIGNAILRIMEDFGQVPDDITLQILLADQAHDPLRVGDVLGPLLKKLGLPPYRDMPPKRDMPVVVTRHIQSNDPNRKSTVSAQYVTLYLFIEERILKGLNIAQSTAASYYAVLLDHFSEKPLDVVEEVLSRRGGGVLGYHLRENLNYWLINGEALTDLYDSLCKSHKCSGVCDKTHLQGFDFKAVRLLASVLQETDPTDLQTID